MQINNFFSLHHQEHEPTFFQISGQNFEDMLCNSNTTDL